ncbi:MAG: methionyl-tRNA formyltransferase [Spirochaetaceae bacterium]|nr:methionyl-tRNA formyltransferase [Spirochaetaceae bacterium]
MKIVFAGSPAFVFPVVQFLACEQHLSAILTNAPSEVGRGRKRLASPLAQEIIKQRETQDSTSVVSSLNTAPLLEIEHIDENLISRIKTLDADLLVCYAFGKIFSQKFLSLFRYGGINIHPSLLPRWRGATPVPAAILAGDTITGVTIQTLAQKMDSGNILAQATYTMRGNETTESLLNILTEKAIPLLKEILQDFPNALAQATPQSEVGICYCSKLKRIGIDWQKTSSEIERTVRALYPNPKAFGILNGEHINITQTQVVEPTNNSEMSSSRALPGTIVGLDKQFGILVKTKDGQVAIQRLQRSGKKELFWKDFINGFPNLIGLRFDCQD